MADAAQQFSSESEQDSEFRKYADLARDRARDRKEHLVSVTEQTRDIVSGAGGVIEHARPSFSSPSGDSFEDDLLDPSLSSRSGALENPSPAFVSPKRSGLEEARPATSNSPLASQSVPDTLSDGTPANSPDYANQFNQAPATSNVPLVSENNAPVGLSAAYGGDNYEGPQTNNVPGGNVQQSFDTEENADTGDAPQAPGTFGARPRSVPQGSEGSSGGTPQIAPSVNQPQARQLQKKIGEREKELKALNKRLKDYKRKFIRPLQLALLAAIWVDTGRAISAYLSFIGGITAGWWWILLIGVIIDGCVVIPFIAVLYGTGAIKGEVAKTVHKELKKHKKVVKDIENSQRRVEQEMLGLRRQQFQLFEQAAAQARSRDQGPPANTPTAGGIPLAT